MQQVWYVDMQINYVARCNRCQTKYHWEKTAWIELSELRRNINYSHKLLCENVDFVDWIKTIKQINFKSMPNVWLTPFYLSLFCWLAVALCVASPIVICIKLSFSVTFTFAFALGIRIRVRGLSSFTMTWTDKQFRLEIMSIVVCFGSALVVSLTIKFPERKRTRVIVCASPIQVRDRYVWLLERFNRHENIQWFIHFIHD